MATLELSGLDDLCAAYNRIYDIPESVTSEALDEMAQVAEKKIKESGLKMGVRDPESNEHILDKVKRRKPKITKEGGYSMITFSGRRKRGRKGVKNSVIAFMNEYGSRTVRARPFVGTALAENEKAIVEPGLRIVGDWIEQNYQK